MDGCILGMHGHPPAVGQQECCRGGRRRGIPEYVPRRVGRGAAWHRAYPAADHWRQRESAPAPYRRRRRGARAGADRAARAWLCVRRGARRRRCARDRPRDARRGTVSRRRGAACLHSHAPLRRQDRHGLGSHALPACDRAGGARGGRAEPCVRGSACGAASPHESALPLQRPQHGRRGRPLEPVGRRARRRESLGRPAADAAAIRRERRHRRRRDRICPRRT